MFVRLTSFETMGEFLISDSLIGIAIEKEDFTEIHTTNNLRFAVYESLDEIAEMLAEVEQ